MVSCVCRIEQNGFSCVVQEVSLMGVGKRAVSFVAILKLKCVCVSPVCPPPRLLLVLCCPPGLSSGPPTQNLLGPCRVPRTAASPSCDPPSGRVRWALYWQMTNLGHETLSDKAWFTQLSCSLQELFVTEWTKGY